MAKTKLEELGDVYRVDNVIKNTYLDSDGKRYKGTHPNALSDGDVKGKGTNGNADQSGGHSLSLAPDISSLADVMQCKYLLYCIFST